MSAARDLTNEELMELIRQRGLAVPSQQQAEPPQNTAETAPVVVNTRSLAEKLRELPNRVQESVREARSCNFLPQAVKTALLDVIIDHIMSMEG